MVHEVVKKYYPLGPRTLLIFILDRSFAAVIVAALLLVSLFGIGFVPLEFRNAAIGLSLLLLALLILFVMGAFFLGWLQYYRYSIFIDEKDFKMERGLISTEAIGVPFRRIQDIKIARSFIDQIFGVSDIVITILGSQGEDQPEQESEIILPAVAHEIALEIQDIVLKKAQVEQISVEKIRT